MCSVSGVLPPSLALLYWSSQASHPRALGQHFQSFSPAQHYLGSECFPVGKGKEAQLQLRPGKCSGEDNGLMLEPHSTALRPAIFREKGEKRRFFTTVHALSSKSLTLGCYQRSRSSKPGSGRWGITMQHHGTASHGRQRVLPCAMAVRQSQSSSPAMVPALLLSGAAFPCICLLRAGD